MDHGSGFDLVGGDRADDLGGVAQFLVDHDDEPTGVSRPEDDGPAARPAEIPHGFRVEEDALDLSPREIMLGDVPDVPVGLVAVVPVDRRVSILEPAAPSALVCRA